MTRNSGPALRAEGEAPTKKEDDAAFKQRWIAFGMALKNKAHAHGIPWQGTLFEDWIAAVKAAENWATPEGECDE